MNNRPKLPSGYCLPGWVECFSYVFLLCLALPICLVAFSIWGDGGLWISAFGLKVYARQHAFLYTLLVLLPFSGGIAAVGLLRRRWWGLVLGLGYSVPALLTCCLSVVLDYSSGLKHRSAWLELILLAMFVRWLVRTMVDSIPSRPLALRSFRLRL